MEVTFISDKLKSELLDPRVRQRVHGADRAKRIKRRLEAAAAADCLEDLRNAPGRLHELTGDRAGQLSVDLDHPYRLLLRPTADPPPTKSDGGLDWTAVVAVTVIAIADTH